MNMFTEWLHLNECSELWALSLSNFFLLAFAVFLCVSVGGEYDCLFPSDPLWVFCNTSEGFKKQISGFIQCLSVVDSSRRRLCILKGMLISYHHILTKMDPLNEHTDLRRMPAIILIRSGHNLRNPSFQIPARYFYLCFNTISDAFHTQDFFLA